MRELAHLITHEAETFGIKIDGSVTVDYGSAYSRSRKVADGRVKGVHFLIKKNGIAEVDGWGEFTDAHPLQVTADDGSTRTRGFDQCIVASVATTRLLPGTSFSERVVTYEEQILTDTLPASILIAGAGAIGIEFAYILRQLRRRGRPWWSSSTGYCPLEDEEVSAELARRYKRLGVEVLTSTRVESIDDSGDKVRVTVSRDGRQQVLEADKVLQAIGFQPRVEGYGLDRTGVRPSPSAAPSTSTAGAVRTCRTSSPSAT